ncbi:polymeric immunoglobulin receptor-like [Salminus brasiliensis]|uniref:polymeric immunoglobulin receptor-like n=1 Tax=Salminus brasiliensis TaxID=930266 RepID=UPI003B83A22E
MELARKPPGGAPEKNQGMRVVLEMTEGLQGHNITCDNFTSYHLEDEFQRLKNVLVMSTMHKDTSLSTREDMKLQMILEYNSTKGGVDNLDKVTATYSCQRKTAHWPLRSCLLDCVDVIGYSGRGVIINCYYSASVRTQSKVVCRKVQICETKIRTNIPNQWVHNGKFHMYDDTTASVIKVFISNLSLQDTGLYRCAFVQDSAYWTVEDWELKVKEDFFSELKTVTAQLGHNASFICEYSEMKKMNPKCLFKIQDLSAEHMMPNTLTTVRLQEDSRRFSISDERDLNMFRVSIKTVTVDDAGLYFCGVQTNESTVSYISAIRNIHLRTASTVIGTEGDVVEVRCPYASNYQQHSKYFCKEKEDECLTEQTGLHSQTQLQKKVKRFSLSDNTTAGVFTVTISGLTSEDSGKYWCAVWTGVLTNYLSMELKVVMKEELHVLGREALNISINCSSRTDSETNKGKFFCMGQELSSCVHEGVKVSSETNRSGRFSLSEDASAGAFRVTITDLREEDSGMYWCGEENSGFAIYTRVHLQVMKAPGSSVVITTVSVCVVLVLLIGGLTLILYRLRCTKTQGTALSYTQNCKLWFIKQEARRKE